jgi:hypothetical protein
VRFIQNRQTQKIKNPSGLTVSRQASRWDFFSLKEYYMNWFGTEVRQEEKTRQRYQARLASVGLTALGDPDSSTHPLLRGIKKSGRYLWAQEYQAITKKLNEQRALERKITLAEAFFVQKFALEFRIKVYPQLWVGNLCLDFFIPAFGLRRGIGQRGFTLKGLAIEIDGPIHNNFVKAKKDEFKEKSLSDLGILLWRLPNEEVFRSQTLPSRELLERDLGRLCSRARADLWTKIHLITVLYHSSDETLRDLMRVSGPAPKLQEVVWKS